MIKKDVDFIFKEQKAIKPKKSIFKKIIILIISIFFLINIIFYIGNYSSYVKNAPEQLMDARKEMVIAQGFVVYELILMKYLKIDINSTILKPFQYFKNLYYNKGLEKLPKNDADRVFWYGLIHYLPIKYDYGKRKPSFGDFTQHYGKQYTEKLLDDIYFNLKLLSEYELSDYKNNKYIQSRLMVITLHMLSVYIYNFHLFSDVNFYSEKVSNEIKNNEKIEKLISIYKFSKKIFNNKIYREDFSKYILEDSYNKYIFNSLYINLDILIISNKLYQKRFICNDDFNKNLVINFISSERNLIEMLNNQIYSKDIKLLIDYGHIEEIKKLIQPCIKEN